MFSGFQSNGFQSNAFQIISGGAAPVETPGDSPTRHSYDLYLQKEEQRLKAKQQQIIDLRLEAQQALLAKRELEAKREKQNTRQLEAIRRREAEIQKELLALINSLREFNAQIRKRQEEEALLVLSLSCPFTVMH